MVFEEKTISSKIVYEGPIFKIRKHIVETRAGESQRDIIEHNGGAVMLAITNEGKVLLEKQYRKALEETIYELPAGKAEPGEDPLVTATRELAEETGYTAGSIKHLTTYHPTCGYSSEKLHIFICRDLTPGETNWDPTECIELSEHDPDEVLDMIMRGEITDSKTLIGMLYARAAGEI